MWNGHQLQRKVQVDEPDPLTYLNYLQGTSAVHHRSFHIRQQQSRMRQKDDVKSTWFGPFADLSLSITIATGHWLPARALVE